MSQVVDTRGKVRTNQKPVLDGAAALQRDLDKASGLDAGVTKGYEDTLANVLQDDIYEKPAVTKKAPPKPKRKASPYSGVSGGTPVSTTTRQPSQSWSPTHSLPSNTRNLGTTGKKIDADSIISSGFSGAIPNPKSWVADTDEEQDELNSKYERMFSSSGLSDEDLEDIRSRGNLASTLAGNRATRAVTDDIMSNPWLNVDANELQIPSDDNDENTIGSVVGDSLDWLYGSMFDDNGNYRGPSIPKRYQNTTRTTVGDRTAIDDGTMDYDHLTADRVRGDRLQQYYDQGMGGRGWWATDPYSVYLKSDEAQHFGYKPWLPDDMSKLNMGITSWLDTPSDLAGALGDIRTNKLQSPTIRYDIDGNQETTDDVIDLDYKDFDYRDTAYYNNINKLAAENPDIFITYPEGGKIHDAPVTTSVLENAVRDINGDVRYAYGNIADVDYSDDYTVSIPLVDGTTVSVPYLDMKPDENGDVTEIPDWLSYDDVDWDGEWFVNDDPSYYKVRYSDGSEIDVPAEEYKSWFDENGNSTDAFPASYVYANETSGTLPENLDSLNQYYRENYFDPEEDSWLSYPVQYVPDMVMSDGTRVNWNQFQDIYLDPEKRNKRSGDFAGTHVAYDYDAANKPSDLMKNNGQLFNEDYSLNIGDIPRGAFDMTMGSLPISFEQFAWPYSVTQALSKSLSGLEANGYDSLTDSDMYMAGNIDEDTGEFVPTFNDIDKVVGVAGNSLVPLTENIAGNVSGRSFIPALSGDVPMNPTLRQLAKAWFLGNLGEGIEEIPGNFFDELIRYSDKAYGMPIDPETGEPLMERGDPILGFIPGPLVPVTDASGNYKFVNETTGEPITERYDSMNRVYKDPNTSAIDRAANFYTDYEGILNALAGGFSVGGVMSLPNIGLIPQAIANTNYRKQMDLPQYVEPEEAERVSVDPDKIREYLENRE